LEQRPPQWVHYRCGARYSWKESHPTQFNPRGVTGDINFPNFGCVLSALDPQLIQLAAKIYF